VQLEPPHVHDPLLHAWPLAQAPHALPPEPHVLVDCPDACTHVPFAAQQPSGHEDVVHSHTPDAPHAWPLAQAPHAAPAAPQEVAVWPA
jgi:hypothetical protein